MSSRVSEKFKGLLRALPFGIGNSLLSWISILREGLKSPIPLFLTIVSSDWNGIIDFSSYDCIAYLFKSNSKICHDLLQNSIVLRRYKDASRFYSFLSDIEAKPSVKVSPSFALTKLVISEIEELSQEKIATSHKYEMRASSLQDDFSSYGSSQDLLKLILEHNRLDCMWTERYTSTVCALQAAEFLTPALADGKYNVVLLDASWFSSVGHFYYLDSLIKGMILDLIPIKFLSFDVDDIVSISNSFLYFKYIAIAKKYGLLWDSQRKFDIPRLYMWVWPDNFGNLVDNTTFANKLQEAWFVSGRSEFELLSDAEFSECESRLLKYIGNKRKKIFTFHVRQPFFKGENKFTIANARNSDPRPILGILSELASDSLHFVMLGDKSMAVVPRRYRGSIFDYPHSPLKSEKFDAFLVQYTKAHIGTLSGISHLPCVFGKPTLITNACPLFSAITTNTVYLPKLYRNSNRYLHFQEFYRDIKPMVYWGGTSALKNISVTLCDNTHEDLRVSIFSFVDAALRESFLVHPNKCSVQVDLASSFEIAKGYNSVVPIEKNFHRKYSHLFL
jgi:putative glycosyltransferase (TIGR04372 family)